MTANDEDIDELIQSHLERNFYFLFIDWPNRPVPKYSWLDREGRVIDMESMSLDHLKASSKTVENALDRLLSFPRPPEEVVQYIEPHARTKLQELKETFQNNITF